MENEDIEIQLLLEAIYLKYGYDFRDYSRAHMKRRVLRRLHDSKIESISAMQRRILIDPSFFDMMLPDFSINVTEMFRDPLFFKTLREEIIPILKTYPHIKIWHAGCSSGEEVYSMAILLMEEGLYNRTQIYATDMNERILKKAREGIYPLDLMKTFTDKYIQAGGKASFQDYFSFNFEYAMMNRELKERIIFAEHNLVTDGVFGEMNLIMCRNVLIYFNRQLQSRVVKLFCDSLCLGGFLCLGPKESLQFTECNERFKQMNDKENIFQLKN